MKIFQRFVSHILLPSITVGLVSCKSNNPLDEAPATFPSPNPSQCVSSQNTACAELPRTPSLTDRFNIGRSQENESNAIQGTIVSSSLSSDCPSSERPNKVVAQATVRASQSPSKAYAGTWIIGDQRIDAKTMAFDRTETILTSYFCSSNQVLAKRIQFWVNPKVPTAIISPEYVPANNIVRWKKTLTAVR